MVGHGGSSASLYLADPTSPIPSHCASIVATNTVRLNILYVMSMTQCFHEQADMEVVLHEIPSDIHTRLTYLINLVIRAQGKLIKAVLRYCYRNCPSCSANAIQTGQATWAIWQSIKKNSQNIV